MPGFARDCDPTLGAVMQSMLYPPPPRVRYRTGKGDWVGEWWTPEPGEMVRVHDGEWIEWESE